MEEPLDRLMREIARGDDHGHGSSEPRGRLGGLGQVDFDEVAVLALEATERVQGLDHAGAAGPAAAGPAGQGEHGHFAVGQGGLARAAVGGLQGATAGVDHVVRGKRLR